MFDEALDLAADSRLRAYEALVLSRRGISRCSSVTPRAPTAS